MAPHELEESWRRTKEHLLEARSHLPESAEGVCHDEILQFEEFVEHNELELALDALERAAFKAEVAGLRIYESMIQAALNMGLEQHAARYRAAISQIERSTEERWRNPAQPSKLPK